MYLKKALHLFCLGIIISFLLTSCSTKKKVDLILHNGKIYAVDSSFSLNTVLIVNDGKIQDIGNDGLLENYTSKQTVDLKGKPVYPGFIDAHCHFYGYGVDLEKISLFGTKSFDEVIKILQANSEKRFLGWIFARGWDQNDWIDKEYPTKAKLDSLFPDVPVFLMRIDGHAALVNQKGLDLAGITTATKINGGEIIYKDGKLTGLLIDNAVDLVLKNKIGEPSKPIQEAALLKAQQNCFIVGLTTVDDAGLDHKIIELIDELQQTGKMKMRMYAMITHDSINTAYYFKKGVYKTDRLNVRSFKIYGDGALGSRGAAMLHHYHDKKNHYGFLLRPYDSLLYAANEIAKYGFQLNTHCIGDSANRSMLTIYAHVLKTNKHARWRIEHCQVVAAEDFSLFKQYGIIPSVQPTHATSDMYWAEERIGKERIKGAYAYQKLLAQNNLIANGSDFPVEDINPLHGFYAAVVRKDKNNFPTEGFQAENKLTREQALKAMTIWAAYANFEEKEKGSLEKEKFADFVILEDDIMTCKPEAIHKIKVISTYLNGEKVYDKE